MMYIWWVNDIYDVYDEYDVFKVCTHTVYCVAEHNIYQMRFASF